MKAVGVIVEYNPFHNGHAFHLQAAKEAANADIVIAVMSGNFLQRGEPALVSKWHRTRMALLNGVDIVFELPYRFAVQKAEIFANGAVSILEAAGCNSLCFGSESGEISSFYQTIEFLREHQQHYEKSLNQFIQSGVSYPKAAALSFQQLRNADNYLDLAKPNNILGFHYIKAVMEQGCSLAPLTVSRKNADYHDEHFASATIASATSIRKAIFSGGDFSEINQYVPQPTQKVLADYYRLYGMFHQWENYWPLLQFRFIHSTSGELGAIYEAEEGLENRLKAAALEAESFSDFMNKVKTKRYTWTRLQRLCVHILLNVKKEEMKPIQEKAGYLRLLGMTSAGKEFLRKQKKHLPLPLVSKLSAFSDKDINMDIKASRVYSLGLPVRLKKEMMEQEYKQPPILIT